MIRLSDWMVSVAEFSEDQRFRQKLIRNWTAEGQESRMILWIGMNSFHGEHRLQRPFLPPRILVFAAVGISAIVWSLLK